MTELRVYVPPLFPPLAALGSPYSAPPPEEKSEPATEIAGLADEAWGVFQAEEAVRDLLCVRTLPEFEAFVASRSSASDGFTLGLVGHVRAISGGGLARSWTCFGRLPLASGSYFLWGPAAGSIFGAISGAVAKASLA